MAQALKHPLHNAVAKLGRQLHAWSVWMITMLFTALQFLCQLTTGVFADAFMHSFQLNSLSLGFLVASYYVVYVPMQGPSGMLLDRYGPRYLLTGGALLFTLAIFGLAHAPSFGWAVASRMLMGFGASIAFIGCINTGSRWFPRHYMVALTAGLELMGILTVLMGDTYLPSALHQYGWRSIMLGMAYAAVVVAVLIGLFVRNESPYRDELQIKKPCHSHNMVRRLGWRKCLFAISRRKSMWLNGLYCGVTFSFVTVFSALWGIPYLQHVKGINLATASRVDNYLLMGVLLGCLIMIFVQNRIKNNLKVMHHTAMLMGVVSFSVVFYPYLPMLWIKMSLFFLGVCSPVYLLCFRVCANLLPDSLRASSTGFTNMMMVAIAPFFQLLFAGLVTVASHYMLYFHAEQIGMALFPVLILAAGTLTRWIEVPKNRPLR